jgi:transposase
LSVAFSVVDTPFFPTSSALQLEKVVLEPQTVVFVLRTSDATATCPDCRQQSRRVHSRYRRHLTDLPTQGRAIRVQLRARRFFCPAADCPRRIFTERLPEVVAPQARTTRRLHAAHCDIGFALGGEAGARLAARLAMPTSPDTLLRRVRQSPILPRPRVRVLGVDDWAFRKGHHYGTLLCDLEQRCPVDLLPERSADALCAWLKEHPEVEIISRDRADDYIRGATAGAPQAVQVADRWHLLRNLRDALKGTADRHHADVQAAAQGVDLPSPEPAPIRPGAESQPPPAPSVPPQAAESHQAGRSRREATYEEVLELHQQGISRRRIAAHLGLDRSTVRRYLEAGSFPKRGGRRYPRRTDSFADYLKQRWAEGCRNAAQLFAELRARGFNGSYYAVRRQLACWRKTEPGTAAGSGSAATRPSTIGRPSARRVAWLLLKEEANLEPDEEGFLERLQGQCPELRTAAVLGREFAAMVREHREEAWEAWQAQATTADAAKELRSFAEGLKKDEAAVRAALRLKWSNGQVEGQVNRLKTIKRQMYGRAKFDLLRQRVLNRG